jgi:hypothetical protein
MRPIARGVAAALLIAAVAAPLHAQGRSGGSIAGTVTDSVRSRPAAGAIVLLTRLSPEPTEFHSAASDDRGRYHFDSLTAGQYEVAFETDYLDSLALTLPSRTVTLGDGERLTVDFAVPSGATLRAAACPGLQLPKGEGAIIGEVTDADSGEPLRGAQIAVSWVDLAVDRTTLQPITTPRSGAVAVDSLGQYRLCGVPTDTRILVQVQHEGRAGSTLALMVGDEGGVTLRNLSLSRESSRSITELDSAARVAGADTLPPKRLTGTASLTGTVRSASGQPLSDAQVRIVDAAGVARTDSLGRFSLTGQPSGTQLLETRRVGYLIGQSPVDLRGGRSVETFVTLTRIVNLDSIRIVARRSQYPEFERRAGRAGFGHYLDEQQLEKKSATTVAELFQMMPGFRVVGFGLDAKVVSTRGAKGFGLSNCDVNVVIDGMQHQEINLLEPGQVGAVEAYGGPAGAPLQYDSACGLILLWTKR